MLIGFEALTKALTADELRPAKIIARSLITHVGKDQAITNGELRQGLNDHYNISISDIRIRKIIHALRVHGVVKLLVATSKGYYVSHNHTELANCIESLAQRERSIKEVRESIERQWEEFKSTASGVQSEMFL